MACLLACFMAACLLDCLLLACLLACLLAAWWVVGGLAGWVGGWMAGCCWLAGLVAVFFLVFLDWVVDAHGVFVLQVSRLNGVSDLLVSRVSLLLIQSHFSSDAECSSRVQISSQPDPQTSSGALIHVPRYLGNLPFRVWKKMQDIVHNSESGEDVSSYTRNDV